MESPERERIPTAISDSESEEKDALKKRIEELEATLIKEKRESAEVIAHFERQLEKQFEQLGIDPLTETNNRRSFDEKLGLSLKLIRGEVKENRAGVEPLTEISLIMLDLDHFKQVNDTLGHTTGDNVLKKVVVLLKESLRETDMLARFGGDEFCVLLPRTNENDALIVAEKLRVTLENDSEIKDFGVTASIGVCWSGASNATDSKTLIENADAAAYEAKENGRNQVRAYREDAK